MLTLLWMDEKKTTMTFPFLVAVYYFGCMVQVDI